MCEVIIECKYYGNIYVINYIKVNIYDVKKECVDILIIDLFSFILLKIECEIGSLKYFLRILIIFFLNLGVILLYKKFLKFLELKLMFYWI